jgi:quercetin dioxygenase-like cupin family protein
MTVSKRNYVVRANEQPSYGPANHTGTKNIRLVSAALNGAQKMEIIVAEVDRGAGVSTHAHPGMEQAQYILEGEARVEIEGEVYHVGPGDMCFFPEGVFHAVTVTSARMKTLVVYSPPYAEQPDKVIKK